MATSPYAICEAVITAVKADATITTYVTTNFGAGATLTAYLGVDPAELPPETKSPWFGIQPTASQVPDEDNQHTRSHDLTCVVAVKDEATTTAGNVTKYTGISKCYGLFELIYNHVMETLQATPASYALLENGRATLTMALPWHTATWTVRVGSTY